MAAKAVDQKQINEFLKDGILLFNRHNVADSLEKFGKVLDLDPVNPEANYYLGLAYTRRGDFKRAVVHLKSIVDMNINFLFTQQCRMLLGYIYFTTGEYKRAENEFLKVKEKNLNIIQVYAALSSIYYHLDDRDQALEYAQRAYDEDPYNLNAKNTYAFLLCDYGIDVKRGLEMIKEVVRIKPGNAAYLDTLGWAYYKKGDIRSSVDCIRQALDLSDNNEEVKAHYNAVLGKSVS